MDYCRWESSKGVEKASDGVKLPFINSVVSIEREYGNIVGVVVNISYICDMLITPWGVMP